MTLLPKPKVPKAYQTWRGMINRCYRAKTNGYHCYGGRGIQVADRWRFGDGIRSGFKCFLEDVGQPPSPQHSIERVNNDGNYEPGNCKWIPFREQSRNRRSNRWLTGFGRTQLMEDWAKEYSIDAATLYDRVVARGMTIEQAILHVPTRSKLTAEQVVEIRKRRAAGGVSLSQLAKDYGVSKGNIVFILKRQWWKHLP